MNIYWRCFYPCLCCRYCCESVWSVALSLWMSCLFVNLRSGYHDGLGPINLLNPITCISDPNKGLAGFPSVSLLWTTKYRNRTYDNAAGRFQIHKSPLLVTYENECLMYRKCNALERKGELAAFCYGKGNSFPLYLLLTNFTCNMFQCHNTLFKCPWAQSPFYVNLQHNYILRFLGNLVFE